jgi:hypothetical protein
VRAAASNRCKGTILCLLVLLLVLHHAALFYS